MNNPTFPPPSAAVTTILAAPSAAPPPAVRIAYFDIAKGIGILLVVLGHVLQTGKLQNSIFLFHMPLFFFVAGFLFKPGAPAREFAAKKAQQLLLPYVSFWVLVYGFQTWDFLRQQPFSIKSFAAELAKGLLGGQWLVGYTSAFWFVPVLYAVLLLANKLFAVLPGKKLVCLALATLCLAYLNQFFAPGLKVPYNMNVMLGAFPIFTMGYLFKQWKVAPGSLTTFSFFALGLVLSAIGWLPKTDMEFAQYGIPFLSLLLGTAAVLALLEISAFLTRFADLANGLAALGKASLVVMFLHQPVQILLQQHLTGNIAVRVLASVILPYCCYLLFKKSATTSLLFLGQVKKQNMERLIVANKSQS